MNRSYRISFDHKVSKFVIEIQGFLGLYWTPSCVESRGQATHETRYFPTYQEAASAVTEMGLDKIYSDFTQGAVWDQHGYQPRRSA